MERRTLALLVVLLSAVLVVGAALHPTWFTRGDTGPSYFPSHERNGESRAPGGTGDASLGSAGRGVNLVALAAVPLLIAAAVASARRRLPFLLRALAGIAIAAFGLMSFITRADMSQTEAQEWDIGPGFVLGLAAALVGIVGIALLATGAEADADEPRS